MELLPAELRARLPPLLSQEAVNDPHVYAKLILPGTSLIWFVLEGEATGYAGFVLGCFFREQDEASFGHYAESFLLAFRGPNNEVIQQDCAFIQGMLTDVVPAPDS